MDRRKNKPAQNVTQKLVQFTEQEKLELKKTTVSLKQHILGGSEAASNSTG